MTHATSSQPPPGRTTARGPVDLRRWTGDRTGGGPRYDGLVLDLKPRDRIVELHLAGDLDLATAPRLVAAMAWLRRRWRHTIVVDTRGLQFVDLAGYRAFDASLRQADGSFDPRTLYLVGDVLARLQTLLARLSAGTGPAAVA